MSEPLGTYRKRYKLLSKPGGPKTLGVVYELPAYCVGDSRYRGGMISTQASAWNVRTYLAMQRESHKWMNFMRANTNAPCRGGVACSSEEALVMSVERRGHIILLATIGQPEMGGACEVNKAV